MVAVTHLDRQRFGSLDASGRAQVGEAPVQLLDLVSVGADRRRSTSVPPTHLMEW